MLVALVLYEGTSRGAKYSVSTKHVSGSRACDRTAQLTVMLLHRVERYGRRRRCSGRGVATVRGRCRHVTVRRGLVERPEDWLWSSARWYAGIRPVPIAIDATIPVTYESIRKPR